MGITSRKLDERWYKRDLLQRMNDTKEPACNPEITLNSKLRGLADAVAMEELGYKMSNEIEWHKRICAYEIITEQNNEVRNIHSLSTRNKITILRIISIVLAIVVFACILPEEGEKLSISGKISTSSLAALICITLILRCIETSYRKRRIEKILLNSLVSHEDVGLYMNSLGCYISMNKEFDEGSPHKEKIANYLSAHDEELEDDYQQYLEERTNGKKKRPFDQRH